MSDSLVPDNSIDLSSLVPEPEGPPNDWEHIALYEAVHHALLALPAYFKSELNIAGVPATDLHTFNTSLGATIEAQVVETLNQMRSVWDPNGDYALYNFVRQSQRFPDVILRTSTPSSSSPILMGIELKGWYILAKEGEPSYRYKVTPAVCAPWDLLVVFPWVLSNVISGVPRLLSPYIVSARYAAMYRNWHWQFKKNEKKRTVNQIKLSSVARYYPTKGEEIVDVPYSDNGSNFGRFARTGLMDQYKKQIFQEKLSGIPIEAWYRFLRMFSEDRADEDVSHALELLAEEVSKGRSSNLVALANGLKLHLEAIVELLNPPLEQNPPPRPAQRSRGK